MWGSQGWNQWALQPAMFNDVPHEQIDWAALAKQWIQMQQTQPSDSPAPPVVPPVPPPAPSVTAPSIMHPPPPGHGPMVPEEYPQDVPATTPLLKTPVVSGGIPEPFVSDRPFEMETGGFIQKPLNNTYWNKSDWGSNTAADIDDRLWTAPPVVEPTPPIAPSIIAGKETYDYGHMHDNPPLAMQSIDYNHMSDFPYNQPYPPETPYDQYWSQVNAAPPPIAPMFLKKEHTTSTSTNSATIPVEENSTHIDAAKRKQLPAWIREGLEKMEQERIKKIEKEKAEKEKAEKLAQEKLKKDLDKDDDANPMLVKSKFDSDSDADVEEIIIPKKEAEIRRSPSPIEDIRSEEEKRQDFILQLRRIMTELLLTVTNAEMYSVAEEVLRKEKLKARQLASTATLTTVASGLCSLANYGSESEASEVEEDKESSDSDEELYRRIREKKKAFAIKQKKILAELERKELEEQNEALKHKNDNKSEASDSEDPENSSKERDERSTTKEEFKPVSFIPPSDLSETTKNVLIPFIQEKTIDHEPETSENSKSTKELKKSDSKDSRSSRSSDSESGSESSSKRKRKLSKSDSHKRNSSNSKDSRKDKKHRHGSSDSDGSDRPHKNSKSYDESSKKNSSYKKKKKYKRSDSSSSSSSSPKKKRYSSKSESSHNHSRERRSYSYDRERKHRRSSSPRSYRSSRDLHRSRDSHSHRHEDKYSRRDKDEKYYDYKRSPSPHRRSKLPKKYQSSRSPSSERESSRHSKRTRSRH